MTRYKRHSVRGTKSPGRKGKGRDKLEEAWRRKKGSDGCKMDLSKREEEEEEVGDSRRNRPFTRG